LDQLNIVLVVFGTALLLLNAFSSTLQRISLPAPLVGLAFGALIGPYALDLVEMGDFGIAQETLLEHGSRLTLGVGLMSVGLRLPHGYWRPNRRWVIALVGLGMPAMWMVASGIVWAIPGVSLTVALLLGAILTPTDPVASTPIVTGSIAERNVPDRVRLNISSESGLNDGLGYAFVFLPLLTLTSRNGTPWSAWITDVILWEILGGVVGGIVIGALAAKLFVLVTTRNMLEESAYFGFMMPLALLVLGLLKLLGTDGILGVFVAAAVFGQMIPQKDEVQENMAEEIVSRFFTLPIFILLGIALPFDVWRTMSLYVPLLLLAAILFRRILTVWALRPLFRNLHSVPETFFLSWFAALGVSALYYATVAERLTGNATIFDYVALAITLSLIVHGVTATPFGAWLRSRG
jgi:NhaP-type Na+/H+ or K+/H+ antiporter